LQDTFDGRTTGFSYIHLTSFTQVVNSESYVGHAAHVPVRAAAILTEIVVGCHQEIGIARGKASTRSCKTLQIEEG